MGDLGSMWGTVSFLACAGQDLSQRRLDGFYLKFLISTTSKGTVPRESAKRPSRDQSK